ncbi:MAG: hypothetical protein ACOZF2_08025 [Thermodesulfobacteriota bacterium]
MMRRTSRGPVVCLALLLTAILGLGYDSSAQAQTAANKPYLVFSTYLGGKTAVSGGTPRTFAQNAACDAQGNIYVTGGTEVTDLPVKNAFQPSPALNSALSAFVAKYDPGGVLLWCTYLGGDAHNMGIGVAAMPDGGVAVSGLTTSGAHGPFPTKNGFQPHHVGNSDYFVTVFDKDGNLRYSTLLGG